MGINMSDTPSHVGMILDGNRRWALKHALKPWEGHKAGKENLQKMLYHWIDTDIKYLTLYSLSLDNFKNRNEIEKKFLLQVIQAGFDELVTDELIKKGEVNVNVIGRWELLPENLKKSIQKAIDATKDYNKKFLRFAICYDGQDELVHAAQNIANKEIETVTPETIKQNLFTKDLPPVDLLIRTGGEKRLSGFLLWDASYAELYFTEVLFPDAVPDTFDEAVEEFKNRQRRFGK